MLQKARQADKAREVPYLQKKTLQMQPTQDFLPHPSARITVRGRRAYSLFIIYPIAQRSFTSSHLKLDKVSWQYICTIVPARRMKGGGVIQEIVW